MTRENAILCLKGIKNYGRDTFTEQSDWQDSLDMAIKALEQKPGKGKWISKPHVYGVTYCSECNFELKIDDTNYCPNCGAKMEKRLVEVEDGE